MRAHVLAANVDLALVTEPLPDPKARRLERFAALAAAGGVPVALVLTKADLDEDGYLTAAALARRMGVADARRGQRRSPARASASLRSLLTPGHDRRPARRLRHRQVDARQRAAGRGAPEDRRGARVRRARPPHHRHPRAARAPGGALLIDTPGHPRSPACGTAPASPSPTSTRSPPSAASPTAATTPSRAAPSARALDPERRRRLAQAPARAGLGRRPPRRATRPRGQRTRVTSSTATAEAVRAGEGNRTPIFGLGSQRLSHWTTPAEVGSVTDADTLADVRMRVFWPVTLAAAALVGLLAYGVVSKGTDTTLDDAVAKGQRPAAPMAALPWLGADGHAVAGGLQGQGRRAERLGLVVRPVPRGDAAAAEDARARSHRRAGSCSAWTRRTRAARRSASSRSARRRSRACATATATYGREFGVTGYPETFLIDRKGRVAALRRFPVTQAWLDQHLPKLLAEKA